MSSGNRPKGRLDGEGSVYQRADGRWVASVSLGRSEDGHRHRRVAYGWTRDEALAAKRELLAEKEGRGAGARRRTGTLDDYLRGWLDGTLAHRVAVGEMASSTRETYERKLRCDVFGTALGRKRLRDLEPDDVRAWLAWLTQRPTSRGRVRTPGGVALVFRVLRSALNDAVEDGLLVQSPARHVHAPGAVFRGEPLTFAEVEAILASPSTLRPLFATLLFLGLRHGEALALRWDDVDLDAGVVRVPGTKTRASRASVPIPGPAIVVLREHRAAQRERRMAAAYWGDAGLVFASTAGTLLSQSNVSREFNRVCEVAGVPHRRIHDLRHTTASLLYAAGVPVETISVILRHKSATVTREIYTHVFEDVKREAADALGGLFDARQTTPR